MKRKIFLAILILLVIILGFRLDRYSEATFQARTANISASSAFLDIIGELRYTAAAVLWLKTDFYQHEYEGKKLDSRTNEPIMPLIRLVTLLDPHFVQAYDYGAFHLTVDLKRPAEGEKFLLEGLQYNPDSFALNWEYGFLKFYQEEYEEALPYLLKARSFRNKPTAVYTNYMKMVWVNTRLVQIYRHFGNLELANYYQKELNDWLVKNSDLLPNEEEDHRHCGHDHEHHEAHEE